MKITYSDQARAVLDGAEPLKFHHDLGLWATDRQAERWRQKIALYLDH